MAEGFVYDRGDYEIKRRQVWVEGQPESSFWSGLKASGREAFTVKTFRCADCGYLEFYTTEKADT